MSTQKPHTTGTTLTPALSRASIFRRLLMFRSFVICSFILYTFYFIDSHFSITTVSAITVLSAVFSFVSWLWHLRGRPVVDASILLQLTWDALSILIFVYATGRSTNPFIYYLLVVIAISASILREQFTWLFTTLSVGAYSLFMYLDLGVHAAHMDADFKAHLLGMWVNFAGSAILICFFVSRLASALQQRERALGLAREEILKNEQVIGIGTLAASTVHSFGTPLSTITLASNEIREIHPDLETVEYIDIIETQIDRCKNTMAKLSSIASHKDAPEQHMSINNVMAELKEHFLLINAHPMPVFDIRSDTKDTVLPGGMLLLHAVINLIENAVRAANNYVKVSFTNSKATSSNTTTSNTTTLIYIDDDGSGLTPDAYEQLGERAVESKSGLGIGILLANSTIEQLGGHVRFTRMDAPLTTGNDTSLTRVVIELPMNQRSLKSN